MILNVSLEDKQNHDHHLWSDDEGIMKRRWKSLNDELPRYKTPSNNSWLKHLV